MINFSYQDKLMENRFFKEKNQAHALFNILYLYSNNKTRPALTFLYPLDIKDLH